MAVILGSLAGCTPTVDVRVVDDTGFRETVAQHHGKVVLVDFWATWCPPCLEQFPHTIQLGQKYAHKGLAVVSVSVDNVDERAKVLEFLREQEATSDNLMSQWGFGERTMDRFQVEHGTVPFYQLYGRDGQLRHTFSGELGEAGVEQMETWVKELLAEPEP